MADPTPATPSSGIGNEIMSFIHGIDAMQVSLRPMSHFAHTLFKACGKSIETFLEKHGKQSDDGNLTLTGDHLLELKRLTSRLGKAAAASSVLPQTLVVALVSQYDSFLGGLLRCLYRAKPELLIQSKKQLSYSQLSDFGDLESAKAHILEKEIEDLLRASHVEQFNSMSNDFKVKLKEDLYCAPKTGPPKGVF
jgi:hypothetical protein